MNAPRPGQSRGEDGWVMLALLLAMALLVIFAAAIVPSITFDIKRDREEEMIHRGVQYSRAIRAYYKKFGNYPTKIEDLESANNLRFLRKRYKDPLNCKNSKCGDFKLLHFGDVPMTLSGIGGGPIPGATPVSGMNGGTGGPGASSQSSTFGGNSAFGANSNSSFGQNQQGASTNPTGPDTSQPGSQAASGASDATGATPSTGTIPSTGANPSGTGNVNSASNQLGSGQIIGGPIIGVASVSKDKTIREFNHKNKYKDWAFVYDPGQDQGLLITTPYQPQLQGFGQQGMQNANGQNGTSGPGFGTAPGAGSSAFGSPSSGMQNNPNTPSGGGFGASSPPSNPPPQQ